MNLYDKLMLRKRILIEIVNDELKNVCQIKHTRHWLIDNFATNLFVGLIAYNPLSKKPSMNIEIIEKASLLYNPWAEFTLLTVLGGVSM